MCTLKNIMLIEWQGLHWKKLIIILGFSNLLITFQNDGWIIQNLLSATSVTRSSGAEANGLPPCISSYWFTWKEQFWSMWIILEPGLWRESDNQDFCWWAVSACSRLLWRFLWTHEPFRCVCSPAPCRSPPNWQNILNQGWQHWDLPEHSQL